MTDGELNLFSNNLLEETDANATAWHITAPSLLTISVPIADWNIKYPLTLAPATRNSLTISDKNISRKTLILALRPFVKVNVYENSYMTPTDRMACKCPEHSDNHTPYGPPTTIPRGVASTSATVAHGVDLNVFNEDGARPTQALPDGIAMVLIRAKMGGPPPVFPEDCPIVILSSTCRITIRRTAADVGQTLYMFICYVGNDGTQGQFIVEYIKQVVT